MALAAVIMDLIVCEARGDAGRTPRSPGMTVGAVCGQRHPIGMIGRAVLGGSNSVTRITLGATAIACGNQHQGPGRAVAGHACAMLHGRAANRHPAHRALSVDMAAGTVGRLTNQDAMILTCMDD